MKKKSLFVLIISSILLILTGCSSQSNSSNKKIQITSTPTLFFHGGGSSYHAEEHMVNAAKKAGVAKSVIRAEVSKSGKVTLVGTWPKNAKNPICEVNYENNRQLDFNKHGDYATNVVKALQKKYGIKKINMVGHSLGNISIIYYMLQNGNKKNMPQIQKQVAMAGTFDGAIGWNEPANLTVNSQTGKPSAMNDSYQRLLALRHRYPKQIKLLNIYGDLSNGNDSQVSNASCKSLKYLVNNRPRSYREIKITGSNAKHELLHHNPQVNKILMNFFWGK